MIIIKLNINNVLNQNCIDYMRMLPNDCIDLIIADVPYNIGKNYGNNSDKTEHFEYIRLLNLWVNEFL